MSDERQSPTDPIIIDDDGEYEDVSGHDIDLWDDGSPTHSTPIPQDLKAEWDEFLALWDEFLALLTEIENRK